MEFAHYSYYLVALIPSVVFSLSNFFKNSFFEKLAFLLLWFLTSARYNLGGDYSNYYFIFKDISSGDIPPLYFLEPLFLSLNLVIDYFGFPFHTLIFIADTFFLFSIYKFMGVVRSDYKFIFFSIFLFSYDAYWSSLIYVRQQIAIAFFIFSAINLFNGSNKKFFLFVFLGGLFHNALLLFFPLYFVRNVGLSRLIIVFSALTLGVTFTEEIVTFMGLSHYSYYLNLGSKNMSIGFLTKVFVFIMGLALFRRYNNYFYTLFLVGQLISILKIYVPILGRFELYFFPFHIYGLYLILRHICVVSNQYIMILVFSMIIAYNALSFGSIVSNKSDEYFWRGYKFIFLEDNDIVYYDDKYKYRNSLH
ncbi:EpsG family protein [Vibrio sp. OPT20]|uniref:EpsG family protein n=1 Tax=Vibrio sp. OPT20 TaxID=2778642 RepID=UPI00187DF9AD|nr:EpsG family protein [Vibrio sp. OPT20]